MPKGVYKRIKPIKAWNKGIKTGYAPWKGKKRPDISGENNYGWKGALNYRQKLEKLAGRPKPDYCEICGGTGRICFDHSHETGQFRGWLCLHCNTALGHVRENPKILLALIEYLNKHVTLSNKN